MLKELLYVPVESPIVFTCTEIVSCSVEIVPDVGEIMSQEEAAWAVQLFGTKDFLEKVTVCAGGLDVPPEAENVRLHTKNSCHDPACMFDQSLGLYHAGRPIMGDQVSLGTLEKGRRCLIQQPSEREQALCQK